MTAVKKNREVMKAVNEKTALRALKHRDETALSWLIDRYSSYVSTIIFNIIGASMTVADIEEVASDVFLVLWANADKVHPGKLKAYLGAVARNKAKEKTREMGRELPLCDDMIIASDLDLERDVAAQEQAKFIKEAILAMQHPDREIFLRHYYYCQTISLISQEMGMNDATVKSKLRRGREKLRQVLCKGGYDFGNENIGYDGSYTG